MNDLNVLKLTVTLRKFKAKVWDEAETIYLIVSQRHTINTCISFHISFPGSETYIYSFGSRISSLASQRSSHRGT